MMKYSITLAVTLLLAFGISTEVSVYARDNAGSVMVKSNIGSFGKKVFFCIFNTGVG